MSVRIQWRMLRSVLQYIFQQCYTENEIEGELCGTVLGWNPSRSVCWEKSIISVVSSNSWAVTATRTECIGVNLTCLFSSYSSCACETNYFYSVSVLQESLKKTQPKLGTCKIKTHDLFFSLLFCSENCLPPHNQGHIDCLSVSEALLAAESVSLNVECLYSPTSVREDLLFTFLC